VNAYEEEDESVPMPKTNPKLASDRARALRTFRASRDGRAVTRVLGRLEDVARDDENVVPAIIDAVQAKATLGEISDVFRTVFGAYRSRQEI
jgi:methylmalonyl-CoA mutase N-terminal domain/subunit